MAIIREFRKSIQERMRRDKAFTAGLLDEAVTLLLNGEAHMARLMLRDLVNVTIGFEVHTVQHA